MYAASFSVIADAVRQPDPSIASSPKVKPANTCCSGAKSFYMPNTNKSFLDLLFVPFVLFLGLGKSLAPSLSFNIIEIEVNVLFGKELAVLGVGPMLAPALPFDTLGVFT